jgi:hypothetical protein
MHLVVPHAAAHGDTREAGAQALPSLRLPQLERLLARLTPGATWQPGADSLNLPHEHVLAACRGWQGVDGTLPLAAWAAHADGLPPTSAEQGMGLLTPTHWEVGSEQILLLDPARLNLDEDESRALWDALRGLFESEGWTLRWGAPLRWYAVHASLAALPTASLDRVIGQAIDRWLPERRAAALLRRLQSEVQMLLHDHPINVAREARGELPVNSFWLSGTGRTQSVLPGPDEPDVDERLVAPWRAGDWAAWAEAWHVLDAQRMPEMQARAERGEAVSLTLCGERAAQRFDTVRRGAWQRLTQAWRSESADRVLEAL